MVPKKDFSVMTKGGYSDSFKINVEWFRTFRGPLFLKKITCLLGERYILSALVVKWLFSKMRREWEHQCNLHDILNKTPRLFFDNFKVILYFCTFRIWWRVFRYRECSCQMRVDKISEHNKRWKSWSPGTQRIRRTR